MDVVVRALQRSAQNPLLSSRAAIRLGSKQYSYNDILRESKTLLTALEASVPKPVGQEHGPRIACLANPGPHYVVSQWSTWMQGGIFVPLAVSHPPAELEYAMTDSDVSLILVEREHLHKVERTASAHGILVKVLEDEVDVNQQPGPSQQGLEAIGIDQERLLHERQGYADAGAFILYTSGTTGRPKGVLHTHGSIRAQMDVLTEAWRWQGSDQILHSLPLHHIHGLVNALMCAHYCGACVDFLPSFSALSVWRKLQKGDITVFMGVPTMYSHLLTVYKKMKGEEKARCREAASQLRLAVCGSAAAPLPLMQEWTELSGTTLLERYGMSETGMILSNPLDGPRIPGTVGLPLPGVEVKVMPPQEAGSNGGNGSTGAEGSGELRVRGPLLFREYWRRPDATAEAFDGDGFFLTGDTVDTVEVPGTDQQYFRILGRTSVDIIKSGGYKISALRIENVLLNHPSIREIAVFGIPDDVYGERVVCVGALEEGAEELDVLSLAAWATDHLPPYEMPRDLLVMNAIPRNAMGKVNKKQLRQVYLDKVKAASEAA